MEEVWKIEQIYGKSMDFLGLTFGDKKVQNTIIGFTKAALQRYVLSKYKVRS